MKSVSVLLVKGRLLFDYEGSLVERWKQATEEYEWSAFLGDALWECAWAYPFMAVGVVAESLVLLPMKWLGIASHELVWLILCVTGFIGIVGSLWFSLRHLLRKWFKLAAWKMPHYIDDILIVALALLITLLFAKNLSYFGL